MEALIRFGYSEIGTTKFAAFAILLFIFLFQTIKKRIDKMQEDRTTKISTLIAELERNTSPKNDFIIEQIFLNRFGLLIDYPIIQFLLRSKTPSADIHSYIQGKRYLEFDDSYRKISYKGKITSEKLKFKKWSLLASYFGAFFIAFSLMLFIPHIPFDGSSGMAMYLLFIVCSFMWGYLSLDEGIKPESAILLYEKYNNASK